jgi:hypothetical protein
VGFSSREQHKIRGPESYVIDSAVESQCCLYPKRCLGDLRQRRSRGLRWWRRLLEPCALQFFQQLLEQRFVHFFQLFE